MNTTLPNSTKTNLLFCIGALMAAEHEEAAAEQGRTLVEVTLRAVGARPKVRRSWGNYTFVRREEATAPWTRG
jgi:hypothetical protein